MLEVLAEDYGFCAGTRTRISGTYPSVRTDPQVRLAHGRLCQGRTRPVVEGDKPGVLVIDTINGIEPQRAAQRKAFERTQTRSIPTSG